MKATYYPPNSRVVVSLPDDWHNGQRGMVASTRSVGGYMEQRGSPKAPPPPTTPGAG